MEHIELKPREVFDFFSQINKVPRPSKHEEKMIEFLCAFADSYKLECKTDEAGNVLIGKPGTKGYENRETIVLQAHMDMVCEKTTDTDIDFLKDPIQTYTDGEWLRAKGTTLGADDGIGVAICMALLASDEIEHGPIQCLFTRDEETGLTGAFAIQPGFMSGKFLINLDSEDEGEIFVGCAGGAGTTAKFSYHTVPVPEGYFTLRISIDKLKGGHSGDDINKCRANANKLLARFLFSSIAKYDLYLLDIKGGNLHNAIPRDASALVAIPANEKENIRIDFNLFASEIEDEFHKTETGIVFNMQSEKAETDAMDRNTTTRLISSLQAVHNGVLEMNQDIEGLVETSSNLASIRMGNGTVTIVTSQRSSTLSSRENACATVRAAFSLAGAEVETSEGYPGWKPNPKSEILRIATKAYKKLFGKEPKVKAIHAGLECGLFSEKYPNMDMISFGPTLRGVHSPDEALLIPTVDMVWKHILEILINVPEKQ